MEIDVMGIQAALMMVMVTVMLLSALVVIKYFVTKSTLEKSGPEAAYRKNEAGRLLIMGVTSALMFGLVMYFGSEIVATEMVASVY
ncbi:hypothetical protein [Primorskyibacter sp. 2E233]|uniref:hypothetical protein n=1 Tax=Primorskyibacter sp. 2E233 TaxID=3413431 RepID=UPI003BF03FAA